MHFEIHFVSFPPFVPNHSWSFTTDLCWWIWWKFGNKLYECWFWPNIRKISTLFHADIYVKPKSPKNLKIGWLDCLYDVGFAILRIYKRYCTHMKKNEAWFHRLILIIWPHVVQALNLLPTCLPNPVFMERSIIRKEWCLSKLH